MSGMFVYSREAVRVKVKKCEGNLPPEWRKFSVDPQITSLEVLYSILAKAFDLKTDFGISYKATDPTNGQEVYLPVLSDYDLDAAFLRAHNQSITTSSEPCLNLRVDIKPFSEAADWETSNSGVSRETSPLQQSISSGQRYVQTVQNRLPVLIMSQMEKTFSMVQRALNLVEDPSISQPPRHPLSDVEFRGFLDSVGQIVRTKELRDVIFIGGIEPSLRRVVWKHILNVYPGGMTGRERMDYMKKKSSEYYKLREKWKGVVQKGSVIGELAYVTSMVRKDVLRTDRLHTFYAGSDDNQNIAALFNILTTYALNHPAVSYCQGMSDIASPLLVTMGDEAQAYICFCAIMIRLRGNFMLDGIAMTTKFTHLTEALQYYDPEFYEYLKSQQADDLLFCYRWLLLEMKREFPFDDSLRMSEVLWSSLPTTPPITELPLYEKEFDPPPTDVPIPKSPSVILRTPRENPYTKICALRRQSSALSLFSASTNLINQNTNNHNNSNNNKNSNSNTSNIDNPDSLNKLDSTKRFNQSLDETTIRVVPKSPHQIKSHQSLDESKIQLNNLYYQLNFTHTNSKDDNFINKKSANNLELSEDMEVAKIERPRSVSPIPLNKTDDEKEQELGVENVSGNEDEKTSIDSGVGSTPTGPRKHRALNQLNNKSIFCSTGNLISKQVSANKKSGHFKDLKEKIVASKKGIFASLDKIESLQSQSNSDDSQSGKPTTKSKGHKVVKNFNEFLNFATINKNRISDRLSSNARGTSSSSKKPLIKLTKSSFDESSSSDGLSAIDNNNSNKPQTCDKTNKKPPLQLQLNNILSEKSQQSPIIDGNSPDDSQEYFPMTTSMTRELRLELENLDRQVFGTDFHNRTQFNVLSGCDTPESGDSVDKMPYTEIIYKKLNQNCSIDFLETDSDCCIDESSNENLATANGKTNEILSCPVTGLNGVRNRIKTNSCNYEDLSLKRISSSSVNNDVFIWENPLHKFSNSNSSINQTVELVAPVVVNKVVESLNTPDEQIDLDYDGEIIEENNLGKKSVTPIRLLRKNGETSNNNSNRNSILNDIDSDNSDSWNENTNRVQVPIEAAATIINALVMPTAENDLVNDKIDIVPGSGAPHMTNSCEEASEEETTQNIQSVGDSIGSKMSSGVLPPPHEFGCGNPFLMFLCLTLLLQHRDIVIKSGMDYNEMAMYFDKMVRKHNVTRVLNQARRMYAEYLKSQKKALNLLDQSGDVVHIQSNSSSGNNVSISANESIANT